jgi:deazaflavin-dependent oxidoreductase (nitroreductase family)
MKLGPRRWYIALALVGTAAAGVFDPRGTLFYSGRRPTRAGKALNALWAHAYGSGLLPHWLVSLETAGRRTGQPRLNSLVMADYDGERYLVSTLGERSEWVRNLRASGGVAAIHHGQRIPVRLEEVPMGIRAPILKAYVSRARGARRHFNVRPDAALDRFEEIASHYPVFRIVEGADAANPVQPSVA